MKKITSDERSFLSMLSSAGGSHVFGPEDKVTSEMHRMLRSLDRRGLVAMSEIDGRYRADLTSQGQEEANG